MRKPLIPAAFYLAVGTAVLVTDLSTILFAYVATNGGGDQPYSLACSIVDVCLLLAIPRTAFMMATLADVRARHWLLLMHAAATGYLLAKALAMRDGPPACKGYAPEWLRSLVIISSLIFGWVEILLVQLRVLAFRRRQMFHGVEFEFDTNSNLAESLIEEGMPVAGSVHQPFLSHAQSGKLPWQSRLAALILGRRTWGLGRKRKGQGGWDDVESAPGVEFQLDDDDVESFTSAGDWVEALESIETSSSGGLQQPSKLSVSDFEQRWTEGLSEDFTKVGQQALEGLLEASDSLAKKKEWAELAADNGVRVYRRVGDSPESVLGTCFVPASPEVVFEFCRQLDRRGEWDPLWISGRTIVAHNSKAETQHLQWKAPWPAKPRDMLVVVLADQTKQGTYAIVSSSVETLEIPPAKGTVRADLHCGGFLISPVGDGSLLTYLVRADLKGAAPKSVTQIATRRQPLFIAGIRDILSGRKPTTSRAAAAGAFSAASSSFFSGSIVTGASLFSASLPVRKTAVLPPKANASLEDEVTAVAAATATAEATAAASKSSKEETTV